MTMKPTPTRMLAILAGTMLLSNADRAAAADITFTTGTANYPDTEVSTNGTLIGALNLGTTTDVTVNTVDFDGTPAATIAAGVSLNAGVTATWSGADKDSAYSGSGLDTHTVSDEVGAPALTPIVFSGLTPGTDYEVQIMFGDFRNITTITVDVWDQANSAGAPEINALDIDDIGQIVTGTFTADGTETQNIYAHITWATSSVGPVNALQIRAIPEPSSTALLGLGGLALILRRRK